MSPNDSHRQGFRLRNSPWVRLGATFTISDRSANDERRCHNGPRRGRVNADRNGPNGPAFYRHYTGNTV